MHAVKRRRAVKGLVCSRCGTKYRSGRVCERSGCGELSPHWIQWVRFCCCCCCCCCCLVKRSIQLRIRLLRIYEKILGFDAKLKLESFHELNLWKLIIVRMYVHIHTYDKPGYVYICIRLCACVPVFCIRPEDNPADVDQETKILYCWCGLSVTCAHWHVVIVILGSDIYVDAHLQTTEEPLMKIRPSDICDHLYNISFTRYWFL